MKLAQDILSVFVVTTEVIDKKAKSGFSKVTGPKVYGKKGEKVKLIADHEDISIVENAKGDRYPVRNEFLIE